MRAVRFASAVSLGALLFGACQSGAVGVSRSPVDARPFPAFPAEAVCGPIAVEARFYLDHKRVLGTDVLRDPRVLPIAVKLGMAPGSSGSVRFDPNEAAPRLYLPDGGVLALEPLANVKTWSKSVTDTLASHALGARMLPAFSNAPTDAYLYFGLGAVGEIFIREGQLSRKVGDAVNTMSIDRALLAFDLDIDGRKRTVFVGVSTGDGAKGR